MKRLPPFLPVILVLVVMARAEITPVVDSGLGEGFAKRKLTGVFVAYDGRTDRWVTNDPVRARAAFLPASTFKIPNSLIALECGAVADVDTVIAWDGQDRGRPEWNRDQKMRDALPRSTVWFYQELARRVGEVRMREWVQRIGYGNANIAGGIDVFWLQGALRVSAIQQIEFLRRLRDNALPFRPAVLAVVKEIMIADHRDDWILRAKTGMTTRQVESPVGWYVGWVETPAGPVFFATNVELTPAEAAKARIPISYENLVHLGALRVGTIPP